jgi:CheY-like chemotaxis protein
MKKILVADALKPLMEKEPGLLNRADVKLFFAATNDELLAVHRAERADLIISRPDLPGMGADRLFTSIRNDLDLRAVSLIMVCADEAADRERAEQCRPNAVLTLPVNSALLLEKAQRLLKIPGRESYRVLLSINMEGSSREASFFCRSENISTTGLLLETDRSLAEGDKLKCSFFLPDSRQIIVAGEIVRKIEAPEKSGLKRYGVKFGKLNPDAKSAIEAFVAKKAQMSRASQA